jgi:hypothetical protein
MFLIDLKDNDSELFLRNDTDSKYIADFCRRYSQDISHLIIQDPFLMAVIILKIINRLPITNLHTPYVDLLPIIDYPQWDEIEDKLSK